MTYATTLAFYLHLRTSEKYVQRPDLLQSHPILPRLLTLKQSLHTLEELDFAASDDSDLSDIDDEDESELDWMSDAQDLWSGNNTLKRKGKGLEQNELAELLREASMLLDAEDVPQPKDKTKAKAKRKVKAAASTEDPEPPKKKRKAVTPVFDLVEPELAPSKAKSKTKSKDKGKTSAAVEDVYGEASALDVADAADKKARKKSLQFHVSRIESTAARRAGARAGAIGGDDDIPYRERKREKEARIAKEVAKARAQGDDLDDVDPELEFGAEGAADKKQGKKRRREEEDDDESGGSGGEDGYYDLVQRKSKENKEKKKQEYEAALAASRYVLSATSVVGAFG